MLFVSIGKAKAASTTKQRVARRLNWKYPAGMRVIGEYWLQTNDPTLVTILETENVVSIMSAVADWDDDFDWLRRKWRLSRAEITVRSALKRTGAC